MTINTKLLYYNKSVYSPKLYGCALRILSERFIFASWHPKGGWINILGYCTTWKHKSFGLLFSERQGITKYRIIGNWIFTLEKENKL